VEAAPPPNARLADLDREAHVWLVRPETITDAETLSLWRSLLSAAERQRLDRFRRAADRHTFLIAHALVRWALSHYTGAQPDAWTFAVGRWGRPEIEAPGVPGLQYSLTHTPGLVACLVARDCECGIDAEALGRRRNVKRLAPRVLSAAERSAWEALPEPERRLRFLVYWTLKEAYLKARGVGIAVPPRKVSFTVRGERIQLASAPPDDSEIDAWRFSTTQPTSEHTVATALRRSGRPSPTLVVREGLPDP
jgi:4'-phosphopantetheinyl transferase